MRDLESKDGKEVVAYINQDTYLLNLRRKVTRVGINAESDQHMHSAWAQLKSAVKLIGRMLTGIFWVTPIATESLVALEGDSVTLLGALKYNTVLQSCEIENPIALFLGGRGDLLTHYWQKVTRNDGAGMNYMIMSFICLVFSGCLYGVATALKRKD